MLSRLPGVFIESSYPAQKAALLASMASNRATIRAMRDSNAINNVRFAALTQEIADAQMALEALDIVLQEKRVELEQLRSLGQPYDGPSFRAANAQ